MVTVNALFDIGNKYGKQPREYRSSGSKCPEGQSSSAVMHKDHAWASLFHQKREKNRQIAQVYAT
ncbi:hypothetical protein EGR_11119 [Echinococcus granulosus]|uniref:Uncharacterized protein n=1 Tax=Echinococcus granulosus TaxID=6210 RepID=W6UKK8_ECHGR|nr:hypothetical protein EGR_11119 [Echinococcus granulosus]EUB54024.1 hypothetical protein EGR_11119 [Echinococcus granulosus]